MTRHVTTSSASINARGGPLLVRSRDSRLGRSTSDAGVPDSPPSPRYSGERVRERGPEETPDPHTRFIRYLIHDLFFFRSNRSGRGSFICPVHISSSPPSMR